VDGKGTRGEGRTLGTEHAPGLFVRAEVGLGGDEDKRRVFAKVGDFRVPLQP